MLSIILVVFVLGYLCIALEHPLKVNKTATALLTGVLCWTLYSLSGETHAHVDEELFHHVSEIAQILLFLIGAMTIVELVDSHRGFEVITSRITTTSKIKLLWTIGIVSFFLSAILDNMTTAIVMVSLLGKLVSDRTQRLYFAGIIILSTNAGGAWSPIGDVTTTMLWIDGQIGTTNIIWMVFLPSLVSLVVPLLLLSFSFKGKVSAPKTIASKFTPTTPVEQNLIFGLGIGALLGVPAFKMIFHLPPWLGMMFGLSVLWLATELIHKNKDHNERKGLSASAALERIDIPSVLFFLGILLAVACLQSTGQLASIQTALTNGVGNQTLIVTAIGILSAIVDNVPLVKAAQGMYDMVAFPQDHPLWHYMAYCAGTGGSILIIGSASGVAVMGIEKIDFIWYLKKISWLALAGYLAGCLVFILLYGWL